MTFLDLIVGALCSYRLTQLVVWDAILAPAAVWLAKLHPTIEKLLSCAHCSGFWAALLTAIALLCQDAHWLIRLGVWAFALGGAVSIVEHATGWLEVNFVHAAPPEDTP
jgi:hypothetical protein